MERQQGHPANNILNDFNTNHNTINFECSTRISIKCSFFPSISYSQVLRVKQTYSTIENLTLYCSELKGYQKGCKSGLLENKYQQLKK